jgi:hypothetical protein
VSPPDLWEFESGVEESAAAAKNENIRGLSKVCGKFGFRDLAEQLLQFRETDDSKEKESMRNWE